MFTGQTPDITPAQLLAIAGGVAGQLVAWGLIDGTAKKITAAAIFGGLSVSLKLADAYIRGKRAQAHVALRAAGAAPVTVTFPPPPPDAATQSVTLEPGNPPATGGAVVTITGGHSASWTNVPASGASSVVVSG